MAEDTSTAALTEAAEAATTYPAKDAYHRKVHAWDHDDFTAKLPDDKSYAAYIVVEPRFTDSADRYMVFIYGERAAEELEHAAAAIKEAYRARNVSAFYAENFREVATDEGTALLPTTDEGREYLESIR